MSYLAQGLLSGFQTGFSAGLQSKRDDKMKAERDAERALLQKRQAIEDARYEREATARDNEYANRQGRQLIEDTRWEQQQRQALERDARDFAFTKDRAATADLNNMMDRSRQARLDWKAEQDDQELRPIQMDRLIQEARIAKLQADALADPRPKPMQATERLEFNPDDPTAAPKRIIVGPAGGLGAYGAASTPAAAGYRSTTEVADAYKAGKLSRAEAEDILKTQFGITQ